MLNSLLIALSITLMYSAPLTLAAIGGVISERSGVVNIGIEGMMSIGALTGAVVGYFTHNAWLGLLCAGLAGGALALALGIAIQNFPEGAIISMPLHAKGQSKGRAFLNGVFSGTVEPAGALLTVFLAHLGVPTMPYLLSFAAGAMIYVVVEELIPEMSEGEHSNIGVVSFAIGFSLMMALDVALG